jgi:hypothetical protein
MRRIYLIVLCLVMGVMGVTGLIAEENKGDVGYREELMARLFVLLSKEHVVSGQMENTPSLWVDAEIGKVTVPNGKLAQNGMRVEKALLPREAGVVIEVFGPFTEGITQKRWSTFHDAEKRRFEVCVRVADGQTIGIVGSYGPSFPVKTVEAIVALGKRR